MVAEARTSPARSAQQADWPRPFTGDPPDLRYGTACSVIWRKPPHAAAQTDVLEYFPYLDRLWFREYFDFDSAPDYWLVEISGIPFGLMGEMLEGGGKPGAGCSTG